MFLMFHLERPDVLPVGDLGIRRAIERAYGLDDLPDAADDRTDRRAVAPAPHAGLPLPVALARQRALALVEDDPLGQKRLGDTVLAAADAIDELGVRARPARSARCRLIGSAWGAGSRCSGGVRAARRRAPPAPPLGCGGARPEQAEVGVLGAQRGSERPFKRPSPPSRPPAWALPQEVQRAPVSRRGGRRSSPGSSRRRPRRAILPVSEKRSSRSARTAPAGSAPSVDLLGAAPEWLVLVVEDPLHHVTLAAEVDVRDLGLLLKDRAHQLQQAGVDLGDLLELVEHERDAPVAFGGKASGEREQPFERGVDVLPARARVEAEGDRRRPRGRSSRSGRYAARRTRVGARARETAREAISSWIAAASFSASFSFVGVRIRSTCATSTPSRHELLRDPPDQR